MDRLEWRYFSAGRTISYNDETANKSSHTRAKTYSLSLLSPADEVLSHFPEQVARAFDSVDPQMANVVKRAAAKPRQIGALTRFVVRIATVLPSKQLWGRRRNMLLVALSSLVGSYYKGVLNSLAKSGGLYNIPAEKLAFYMTRQFLSMLLSNYITISLARLEAGEEQYLEETEGMEGTEEEVEAGGGAQGGLWNKLRMVLLLDKIFPGMRKYRRALNEFFKYHVYRDMKRINRQLYLIGESVYNAMLTALTKLIVEGAAESLPESYEMPTAVEEEELGTEVYSRRRRRTEDRKSYRREYYSHDEEDNEKLEQEQRFLDDENKEDKEFSRLFSSVRPGARAIYHSKLFSREVREKRIPSSRLFSYLRNYLLRNFAKFFASDEEAEAAVNDVVIVLEKAKAMDLIESIQDLAQKATQLILEEAAASQTEEKMTVDTSEYEDEGYGFDEEETATEAEESEEEHEESEEDNEKEKSESKKTRRKRHSRLYFSEDEDEDEDEKDENEDKAKNKNIKQSEDDDEDENEEDEKTESKRKYAKNKYSRKKWFSFDEDIREDHYDDFVEPLEGDEAYEEDSYESTDEETELYDEDLADEDLADEEIDQDILEAERAIFGEEEVAEVDMSEEDDLGAEDLDEVSGEDELLYSKRKKAMRHYKPRRKPQK